MSFPPCLIGDGAVLQPYDGLEYPSARTFTLRSSALSSLVHARFLRRVELQSREQKTVPRSTPRANSTRPHISTGLPCPRDAIASANIISFKLYTPQLSGKRWRSVLPSSWWRSSRVTSVSGYGWDYGQEATTRNNLCHPRRLRDFVKIWSPSRPGVRSLARLHRPDS